MKVAGVEEVKGMTGVRVMKNDIKVLIV